MKLKIDVSKIDQSKIIPRSYQTREGQTMTAQELSLETVMLKEPKLITEGATWKLMKTHFVCMEQTKEEKEQKVKSVIVGEGLQFVDKEKEYNDAPSTEITSKGVDGEQIDPTSIPF